MIQETGSELMKLAAAGAAGGVLTLVGVGIAIGSKLGKIASIGQEVHDVKTELAQVRTFQKEMIERMTRVETLLEKMNGQDS